MKFENNNILHWIEKNSLAANHVHMLLSRKDKENFVA